MGLRDDLRRLGVDESAFADVDILCLPERVMSGMPAKDLRDAQDSLDFAKYAKGKGARCKTGYDLGINVPTFERRGADVWLGTIAFFGTNVVLSMAVNVVSSYLYDRIRRKSQPKVEPIIHVTLIVVRDESSTQIEYVGDLDLFQRVLKGLNESPEAEKTTS